MCVCVGGGCLKIAFSGFQKIKATVAVAMVAVWEVAVVTITHAHSLT